MSGLPSTYQQVLKNMDRIEQDHAAVESAVAKVDAIDDKVNNETTGIDAINSKLSEIEEDIGSISGIGTRLDTIEGDIDTLETKVGTVEDKVEDLETVTGSIEEYLQIEVDPETGDIKDKEGHTIELPELSYEDLLKYVEILKEMFLGGGGSSDTGALVPSDDGVKVLGIHVNTKDPDTIGAPSTYKTGVTYEIKRIPSDLRSEEGFSGETYCLLVTHTVDSKIDGEAAVSTYNSFNPFQIIYVPGNVYYYKRFATSLSDSWGNWASSKPVIPAQRTMAEMAVIAADSSGLDQLTGEFWYEPLP